MPPPDDSHRATTIAGTLSEALNGAAFVILASEEQRRAHPHHDQSLAALRQSLATLSSAIGDSPWPADSASHDLQRVRSAAVAFAEALSTWDGHKPPPETVTSTFGEFMASVGMNPDDLTTALGE